MTAPDSERDDRRRRPSRPPRKLVDPWADFADATIRSLGYVNVDDWFRRTLAQECTTCINSLYAEALQAAVGPEVIDVKLAKSMLGRDRSSIHRASTKGATVGPGGWHQVASMDPFFPIAVAWSVDVREFAPPLLHVQHHTLLEALWRAKCSLHQETAVARPTPAEILVATFFLSNDQTGDLVAALRAEQTERVWQAVADHLQSNETAACRLPAPYQTVRECVGAVLRWCLSVALVSLSLLEDLIYEPTIERRAADA